MSIPPTGTNVCLIAGTLSRDPELRTLPSGAEILQLDVRVERAEGPAESVPVAWGSPSAAVASLSAGAPVVLTGRVRRRFFRSGGATQSRTEVVADQVVPAGRRVRVARLVEAVVAEIAPAPSST